MGNKDKIRTDSKQQLKQTEHHACQLVDIEISVRPLLLNSKIQKNTVMRLTGNTENRGLTTKLSPSSHCPNCFKYDIFSGYTLISFAASSTRGSLDRSFVILAPLSAEQEAIQSRDSVPLRRLMMDSHSNPKTIAPLCPLWLADDQQPSRSRHTNRP